MADNASFLEVPLVSYVAAQELQCDLKRLPAVPAPRRGKNRTHASRTFHSPLDCHRPAARTVQHLSLIVPQQITVDISQVGVMPTAKHATAPAQPPSSRAAA